MNRIINVALLAFAGLKFSKLFISGGTMLLSIGVYAWIFGLRFAVGFVGLLLLHEMGHYIAARYRGLNVGLPAFIPFVGAWVSLKDLPHNAETEAFIGIAGPLMGTIAAWVVYFYGRETGEAWILALAYSGFMLNLFNLIPLSPFDGGRITAVLSPRLWLLGAPILLALFLWNPSPLLVLMAILAWPSVVKGWQYRADSAEGQSYYAVHSNTRFAYGLAYLGLIAYLALMSHEVHEMLEATRRANPLLIGT